MSKFTDVIHSNIPYYASTLFFFVVVVLFVCFKVKDQRDDLLHDWNYQQLQLYYYFKPTDKHWILYSQDDT